ncbi:MAG: polymerase, partial [Actinomycetota bacterium]
MKSATSALGPDSRLLLVDGHSLAYRAFYALPVENFASPDGQPTNAIHGFVSMLLQVVETEKPTHVAVAFDVSRETFRRAEYPEYKANRAASPVEFSPQVPVIREVLETFGVVNLAVEGFEADDIIATLALAAAAQDANVYILTGDRDALQLVNPNITVLYPMKGVRDLARMTPEAVETKYGVRPDQYADFAALRGDASDNLPSIPGVGEKTAATWLKNYQNLDGIIENAAEVKGKVGEALRTHVSQVLLNRRLTQLVHDVPLTASVDDLHRHLGDAQRIGEMFDRLGFKQLRKRAMDAFVGEQTVGVVEPVEISVRTQSAWTPGQLVKSLETLPKTMVGVYADIDNDFELRAIGFAWQDKALEISIADCKQDDLASLWVFLSDPNNSLIAHGAK